MDNNAETTAVIKRVKQQLSEFFNGDSWVTECFKQRVLSINPVQAQKKMQGHSHSVAELVEHITAWRNFVLQKLLGNDVYDIDDNSAIDWPQTRDWDLIGEDFEKCHLKLLGAIEDFTAGKWNFKVPGRNYSYLYLICGIVQHDYYHYGQIGVLLAALRN